MSSVFKIMRYSQYLSDLISEETADSLPDLLYKIESAVVKSHTGEEILIKVVSIE